MVLSKENTELSCQMAEFRLCHTELIQFWDTRLTSDMRVKQDLNLQGRKKNIFSERNLFQIMIINHMLELDTKLSYLFYYKSQYEIYITTLLT